MDGDGRETPPGSRPGAPATVPDDDVTATPDAADDSADEAADGAAPADPPARDDDGPHATPTNGDAPAAEADEHPGDGAGSANGHTRPDPTAARTSPEAATSLDAPTTATGSAPPARPGIDGPTVHVDRATAVRARRPAAARPVGAGAAARTRTGPPSGALPRVGGEPMPGMMIVDRYRLVAEVGQDRPAGAVLWQARDVTLERDVAITLLTGGWQADARASSTLARATRNAQFEHPHAARVLDVVRPGAARLPQGVLGAAVAEWTPGRDLAQLVKDGPLRPSAALRVVEQLAAAVAEAHRSGLVLGMEHPQRVRVNARASARLAFPLPRGEATVADDVQGLGALLYLLLTARWPVTGGDGSVPARLTPAPTRAGGGPVSARQVRPDLPVELSALVDRTLDGAGGIRTAAAVHRLVSQMREGLEDGGVLLPVFEEGQAIEGEPGEEVWHTEDEPEEPADPDRRRKLRIGVTLLVVATVAILAFLAFQLVSLFGGGGSSAPPLVIPTEAPAAPPQGGPASPSASPSSAPAAPGGTPVALSSVAVYAPAGDPDNPSRIDRAVDNDPSTTWSTSEYRQQFPALKPGVGMMTTFAQPATVASVTVRSPSPGTRIEIRSASAPNVPLGQTQLLGSGTVGEGQNGQPAEVRIPVRSAPATSQLLVWITALGQGDDGRYVSELSEVTILRG